MAQPCGDLQPSAQPPSSDMFLLQELPDVLGEACGLGFHWGFISRDAAPSYPQWIGMRTCVETSLTFTRPHHPGQEEAGFAVSADVGLGCAVTKLSQEAGSNFPGRPCLFPGDALCRLHSGEAGRAGDGT